MSIFYKAFFFTFLLSSKLIIPCIEHAKNEQPTPGQSLRRTDIDTIDPKMSHGYKLRRTDIDTIDPVHTPQQVCPYPGSPIQQRIRKELIAQAAENRALEEKRKNKA